MNNTPSNYYSLRQLEWTLGFKRDVLQDMARQAGKYYRPYDEKQVKKNGKVKIRHIDNPLRKLKFIQKRILKRVLSEHMKQLPHGMVGGVPGKSIIDNAKPHINQEMVVTIDLKNCFPNTKASNIFLVWRDIVGYGTRQANLLTQLTTFRTILPQGAPTSSALCNLVLLSLYKEIQTYADKNGLNLSTNYVDDFTLSGRANVVRPAIRFVIKRIQHYGFAVRRIKVVVMPAHKNQKTTGLLLNKKVNVARKRIEETRNKIFAIKKRATGITEKEQRSIEGDILFVKKVSKEKAEKLKKLVNEVLPTNLIPEFETSKPERWSCRHHK